MLSVGKVAGIAHVAVSLAFERYVIICFGRESILQDTHHPFKKIQYIERNI